MKNEARLLPFFLASLSRQNFFGCYEVIFLDSGSFDDSIEIVKKWGGNVKILSINATEFSFSKTCNYLVNQARSDLCLFFSAHVELLSSDFLNEVLLEFNAGNRIGFFRQVVNHNAGYSLYESIFLNKTFPKRKVNNQLCFSNAGSFSAKEILEEYPFPNVEASEDNAWAKLVLNKGFEICYFPDLEIAHSHNESFEQITRRVRINKLARFGARKCYLKAFFKFIKIFLVLFLSSFDRVLAYRYALAHSKGYL
ncbi:glycosyltransferase family 2 protein [Shewanella sp. C31]|nr:glycosyltransferase family 2 protein [Shewanella electrica]